MSTDSCKTKYPILLVHGAGGKDLKKPVYWGRIPRILESRGAVICYGGQDIWGSIDTNAETIAEKIREICDETGCEKVNIIAHSKGGLEARMAVSSFGAAERTASLTTVSTPHHGSRTIDRLLKMPRFVWHTAGFFVNGFCRLLGDKKPDFVKACRQFSTESMARFNQENPDAPGVYYQSFGCVMKHSFSDIILAFNHFVIGRVEGPNDGLVAEASSHWGEHRTLRSSGFRGISHMDAVDARRRRLTRKQGDGVSDICDVYVGIAEDLKQRGL